jgi:cell filamentation protein
LAEYEVFDDPYCYKNTFVLKNKAGIRDAARLQAFELEMSTLRAEEPLPAGKFTPAHYRKVHHHLFQDVYRWAGRYRTVRTAKCGNWFCYPEYTESSMNQLFKKLGTDAFLAGASSDNFIDATADFLGELNAIHPFREGNGRSQLSFLHLLGRRVGHPLRLIQINRVTFLPAMVATFGGDNRLLVNELRKLLA